MWPQGTSKVIPKYITGDLQSTQKESPELFWNFIILAKMKTFMEKKWKPGNLFPGCSSWPYFKRQFLTSFLQNFPLFALELILFLVPASSTEECLQTFLLTWQNVAAGRSSNNKYTLCPDFHLYCTHMHTEYRKYGTEIFVGQWGQHRWFWQALVNCLCLLDQQAYTTI